MDVKTFSDQLRNRMNEQIEVVQKDESDELKATAKIIQVIRNCLFELKQFIHQYEFENQEEEIRVFKELKPSLVSKYLFYQKVFDMNCAIPPDHEGAVRYCKKHWCQIQNFLKRHKRLRKYLCSGATHLDDVYFRRNVQESRCDYNRDLRFTSMYDRHVGRILAGEAWKEYLENKIASLRSQDFVPGKSKLTWTATKTDLVELIYALHATQSINHGKSQIKELINRVEEFLNVDLGDYYRTFVDIRLRKISQAKFLDSLKSSLARRIEESDGKMR